MNDPEWEEFSKAHHREKDGKVSIRMAAVHMVLKANKTHEDVAYSLMRCPEWVAKWVERFREGGLEALRDLPRSGRPRALPQEETDRIIADVSEKRTTPAAVQNAIHEETGEWFHITYVRKLMRRFGLSRKRGTGIHVNRADDRTVALWQKWIRRMISRLKRDGFEIFVQDEAVYIRDSKNGSKHWSEVGVPVTVPYTGSHEKVVVYGALSISGRQFYRTYDAFNSANFETYIRELHRRFGRIAVIVDRSRTHSSARIKAFLDGNPDVKLIELPVGSPQLNASEETWRRGKSAISVSEYYPTLSEMWRAISEYYRTARFKLDVQAYLYRKALEGRTNF